MSESEALAFNSELRRLATLDECSALFSAAIAPFGFDTFACGVVDLSDRQRSAFFIIAWPDAWTRFYVGSGLIERDPLVDELATRREAYTWSDLRADRKFSKAGRAAIGLAAEAGWTEGLAVPLPIGASRIGLVSMVGRRDCRDPAERAYLTLISICLHSHARTLTAHNGFALPPAGLTERELVSIRMVARGMPDAAIAAAMGVARATAHEFVEKAKRRLNVHSRAELAAIAAALGIVDV